MPPKAVNRHCSVCGSIFCSSRPRDLLERTRCKECVMRLRRERKKAAYRAAKEEGRGRKIQTLTREQMQANVAQHYRQLSEKCKVPPSLPRICEWCALLDYYGDLLRTECRLGESPDASGGCGRWQTRYRVEDEDE